MKPTFPSPSSLSTRQTTRSGTPDGFAVDLVARVGEAFRSENVESETLMLGGLPVRIATPRMLYRMKQDTLRPIDHADAADLKAKFAHRGPLHPHVADDPTFPEPRARGMVDQFPNVAGSHAAPHPVPVAGEPRLPSHEPAVPARGCSRMLVLVVDSGLANDEEKPHE